MLWSYYLSSASVFITLFIGTNSVWRVRECSVPEQSARWGPYVQQLTQPFEHAEGPTWDPKNNVLYFVDIHEGLVYSFNFITGKLNKVKLDGDVTPVIPTRTPNRYVVGLNKSLVLLDWDGQSNGTHNVTTITEVEPNKDGNRFNDGKADERGRLWIGTMGYENSSGVVPNQGSLYKFVKVINGSVDTTVEISPVSISNGLAWSANNKKFFYIDTPTRQIAAYDFDLESGIISNKTVVFDLANYDIGGSPDGMTIDKDDNLYIALFDGGAVIKVNPRDGRLLQTIAIPAHRVTSVMFGGCNLDILFVTTSRFGLSAEEKRQQPAAGSVFAVTGLKTQGRKVFAANF